MKFSYFCFFYLLRDGLHTFCVVWLPFCFARDLQIRRVRIGDVGGVERLVADIENGDLVTADLDRCLKSGHDTGRLVLCLNLQHN